MIPSLPLYFWFMLWNVVTGRKQSHFLVRLTFGLRPEFDKIWQNWLHTKHKDKIPELLKEDGSLAESLKEKTQVLSHFFSSVFTQEGEDDIPDFNIDITNYSTDIYVSKEDMCKALKKKLKVSFNPVHTPSHASTPIHRTNR